MRPPGSFKLTGRSQRTAAPMEPSALCGDRADRIVSSLRTQILESDAEQCLRIRQVFVNPREIFRIEIERPGQAYSRTTLLDRDALEDLLATDDVRSRVIGALEELE